MTNNEQHNILVSTKLDTEALQVAVEKNAGTLACIKDDLEQINRLNAKLYNTLKELKENL